MLAVGPGKLGADGEYCPPDVRKGDTVIYGQWAGTEVKELEALLLAESDILAVVEE